MGEYFTWTRLLQSGGITLFILFVCSIVSFIIIIERLIYFASRTSSTSFLGDFFTNLKGGDFTSIRSTLIKEKSPVAYVLHECLEYAQAAREDDILFEEVKSRAIAEKIPEMEKYLGIEATLGSVSPFVGLLGTVLGIIRSFQSLGNSTSSNLAGLNAGIAEALAATAAGLFVAIPATIAYNHFRRRVNTEIMKMETAASRLKTTIRGEGIGKL